MCHLTKSIPGPPWIADTQTTHAPDLMPLGYGISSVAQLEPGCMASRVRTWAENVQPCIEILIMHPMVATVNA